MDISLAHARGGGLAAILLAFSALIGPGERAGAADAALKPVESGSVDALQLQFGAGVASDYIYRGISLSDRKPSFDASVEATLFGVLYAGVEIASVRLPTQPAAEVTFGTGLRHTFPNDLKVDIGLSYFTYPRELLASTGINYWEVSVSAEKSLLDGITLSGEYAYSPNFGNTGAWGHYLEAGISYDLPKMRDIGVSLSGTLGYSWFGSQSEALGGFPLPAYLNWNAGVTFKYEVLKLDLRYYDTNLSKENCFVFTGDPGAIAGGRIDPITNPDGLTSRWCGAAFVGKLSFKFPAGDD